MAGRAHPLAGGVARPYAIALMTIVLATTGLASPEIEPELDLQLQQTLEALVKDEIAALEPNRRIVASRKYAETEDGGYRAYAILDEAGPQTLKTGRYDFIFRQADGKRWRLAEKVLRDSTERLVRESAEAKQFFRFGSFRFERDGLVVTASAGTGLTYEMQGEIGRILVAADDLEYDYSPPRELGTRHVLYGAMKNRWSDELVFTPDVVEIECDPFSCGETLSSFTDLEETGREALSETLARHYDERTEELRRARTEDPFSGFRLPYRDDSRLLDISIKKANGDQRIILHHDSESGHEVRFHADGIGTIYGYPAEATRREVDPVVIERRDDSDGRLYQLEGLKGIVEIALLESELMEADITFTIRAKRDIDAIPFSIDAILVGAAAEPKATFLVNELEDGEGRPLSWVRRGDSEGIVLLPDTISAGTSVVIHMEFQTKGSVFKFNPTYSYMARSGWLPFVRYHDKIEEFELTIKVPQRYKALGVGTPVSREKQGRVNVSHWVAQSPVHFPTVIFGDYVEDTPKTKAKKNDGSTIPVTVHVDKNSMVDWEIRPGQLRSPGEIAINALNIYRELFGVDYGYGKLDLVNDPLKALGAQAPASIVYLGSAIFRSQATLSTSIARDTTTLVEELIAHEVAHQWWGSLVGSANRRNYWFVESLAEYSAALFMEILASNGYRTPEKGRKAYLSMVKRWRDDVLASGLLCSVQDASSLWSNAGYVAAVYARGPYAFHILRQTFGDETFFAFLKELAGELAGREIVTRDIQRVAERSFGGIGEDGRPFTVDLEWFFDQWVRDVGVPEYTFDYSFRQTEDGTYTIDGTIKQRVFAGRHELELHGTFYRGVVPLTVVGKDKQEYTANLVVEGSETPFALKVPVKPIEVWLNKYGEILARDIRGPY